MPGAMGPRIGRAIPERCRAECHESATLQIGTKSAHTRNGGNPHLPVTRASPRILRTQLPLPLFLSPETGVRAHRDRPPLPLQLQPAGVALDRQLARLERSLHGTARLRVVRAVGEPARK